MRLLISLFLFVTVLFGVELELDKNYVGPKKLTVSQLGVNMGLPHRWEAIAKEGEGLVLFQQETQDTMVLRSKSLNISEAIAYLNEPHYLKNSVKVFPQERIVKLNSRIYRRAYSSNGGQDRPSVLIYVILGPQERAVVMKVQYAGKNDSAIKATTMNIAQALSFTPTKQLKSSIQNLEARLKGAHIAYVKRDGAYDDKRELWLCSNRRYMIQEERTVAGGMSRVHEQKYGKWSVENEQLILQGDDGLDRLIDVTFQDKSLLFDGHRSYELKNHQCK